MDAYDVMDMDPGYEGSCPCFGPVEIDGTLIEGHCWRVCTQCDGCGLHYEGDRKVAERLRPMFTALDWYGAWDIAEGLRRG